MTEPIALVLSDVDGTLVTTDKILTERSREAVSKLRSAGIAFTIVSSRPPFGLRMLVDALGLELPMGAYNGGALVMPDLTILEQRLLPPQTAHSTVEMLRSLGVGVWVFAGDRWMTEDADGAYVGRETHTIDVKPTIVENLDDHLDAVAKIVGVSADFALLTDAESKLRARIGDGASIVRSQRYYLDVTPAGTDKGIIVTALAQRLGISAASIATIGDMDNDTPMFAKSGFSIAMGNATPEVQRQADSVTLANDDDGFAAAVERIILPRARG